MQYRDDDCPSGYNPAQHVVTQAIPTPEYHPYHYRPIEPMNIGMTTDSDWSVIEGHAVADGHRVTVLRFQSGQCPYCTGRGQGAAPRHHPKDRLESLFREDAEHWVVNPRTKLRRQLYRPDVPLVGGGDQ